MTEHASTNDHHPAAPAQAWAVQSQLASDRVRRLVDRAMIGAPSLTQGEVRELAEAVQAHLARLRD